MSEPCDACGKPLDLDATICRACGEDPTYHPLEPLPLEVDKTTLDTLGPWSAIKHDIIEKYARAYTTILSNEPSIRRIVCIDAFAGAGVAIDKATGTLVEGSPLRLSHVVPPFDELYFVEHDTGKMDTLFDLAKNDRRIHFYEGDAARVLRDIALPRCRYADFARGLCLLDPYGLDVGFTLLEEIGHMGSVEIFYNFMMVGANRNVLWKDPSRVPPARQALMDHCWGDRSWRDVAYEEEATLFGPVPKKRPGNQAIVSAFRQRLKDEAGFKYVPHPIPMRNEQNAVVYYLFFASPNKTANKIVRDIFAKYGN